MSNSCFFLENGQNVAKMTIWLCRIKPYSCELTAEYLSYVSLVGGSEQSEGMRYEDENVRQTQKMMAELYGIDVRTVNERISKILDGGGLSENATIRNFRIVQIEGALLSKTPPTPQTSLNNPSRRSSRPGCRAVGAAFRALRSPPARKPPPS